ncbi:MAG: hypothetical protein ACLQU2_03360 [Candidatus Binataceae bacterium]
MPDKNGTTALESVFGERALVDAILDDPDLTIRGIVRKAFEQVIDPLIDKAPSAQRRELIGYEIKDFKRILREGLLAGDHRMIREALGKCVHAITLHANTPLPERNLSDIKAAWVARLNDIPDFGWSSFNAEAAIGYLFHRDDEPAAIGPHGDLLSKKGVIITRAGAADLAKPPYAKDEVWRKHAQELDPHGPIAHRRDEV